MLDTSDVQGNILRGYTHRYARFLFVTLPPTPRQARHFLDGLLAEVTTGAPWGPGNRPATLNVAFTAGGLAALGVPEGIVEQFPDDFRQGMAARASALRDAPADQSRHWEPPWQLSERIHALVSLYDDSDTVIATRVHDVLGRLAAAGGKLVVEEAGERLGAEKGSTEHFGFADGLSQPQLDAVAVGEGSPDASVLATGEILLGHRDGEGFVPDLPAPSQLSHNGTFLVFRKLAQDVAAFRRTCAQLGAAYPGGPEELGAKLMGRWPDGRHLGEPGREGGQPTFEDDALGAVCPVGAHIRRANPRRSFGAERQTFDDRHRMIRRGMPYGKAAGTGTGDDGIERGLLFVCLCASIARQFEFVQSEWLNDGNALGLGDEHDPISASHPGGRARMTIPAGADRPPWIASPLPRLVTVRGGAYFFLPSLTALRWLASAGREEPTLVGASAIAG